MGSGQNEATVRRYWNEVWNAGNLAAVEEFYVPDCLHGEAFSVDNFKRNVERTRAAFPDFHVSVDDMFSTSDTVVTRVTYTGTHRGYLGEIAPTGRNMKITGIDIFRIVDDKCVEHWHEADHLAMMQQLGLTPL